MDDFINKIIELENNASNEGTEFAINSAIYPFTNIPQSKIAILFQVFVETHKSAVVNHDQIVRWFSNNCSAEEIAQLEDFIPVFINNGSDVCDGFEILFTLILYSCTTQIVKIEDLFDTFHFCYTADEDEHSLCKEEFVLSMKSIICALKKIYGIDDMMDEEDIFNLFTGIWERISEDEKLTHERFVAFVQDENKWLHKFLKAIAKYNESDMNNDSYEVSNYEGKKETNDIPLNSSNGGDEFMAVKPWKGAIFEPTKHNPVSSSPPDASLMLDWIYGYRGYDCRNNLFYTNDGKKLIYHSAGVGILYDKDNEKQSYNLSHDDDIICLAVDPSQQYVATGQLGAKPKVVVWSIDNPNEAVAEFGNFHKRAVTCVAFSLDGEYLVTVGQDDNHMIVIYKWQSNKRVCAVESGKIKVLDCQFISDKTVVSCGAKEVKIWNFSGKSLVGKKGLFGKYPIDTVLCISPSNNNENRFLTGTLLGNIYLWENNKVIKSYNNCHKGGVYTIKSLVDESGYVSGGKDGCIIFWKTDMTKSKIINSIAIASSITASANITSSSSTKKEANKSQIKSLCLSNDMSKLLVGTNLSEIYEIDLVRDQIIGGPIVTGHYKDELWGLATNPNNPEEIATAGDDKTLRLWDVINHQQISGINLPTMTRVCTYSLDGQYIICGLGGSLDQSSSNIRKKDKYEGTILAIKLDDKRNMTIIKKCQDSKKWISEIKMSPLGNVVAVGSHDNFIYLYKWPGLQYISRCRGHSSYITHFDFSTDGKYLQSNCGAYELLFWDTQTGKQITKAKSLRDVNWSTQTCVLGWGVQGIWPECSDGTDVNAVDLSPKRDVLATSDDFGLVKLFRYPCVEKNSGNNSYIGHSSHVTCVRFGNNNGYLYSTGGNDKSLFQWKYDSDDLEFTEQSKVVLSEAPVDKNDNIYKDPNLENFQLEGGDEFMAVKPWLGAICEPDNHDPINSNSPNLDVNINWVYGYQSQTCRNNLRYNKEGNLVYNIAALGIIYNPKKLQQSYNQSHNDDITALAIHPNLDIVATGQLGANPKIVVWNSTTGETIKELTNFHKRSIILLSFNTTGNLLGSIGNDNNHTVAIYDWNKGIVKCSSKGEVSSVLDMCWSDNGVLCQCGEKHVRFWEFQGKNMSGRKGLLTAGKVKGKTQTFPTVCYAKASNTFVVGTLDGKLYLFNDKRQLSQIIDVAKGAIMSMYSNDNAVICGNKAGLITMYKPDTFEIINQVDITEKIKTNDNPILSTINPTNEVRSICINKDNKNKLLIGTRASNIYEYSIDSDKLELLVSGHCKDELWGLAINPVDKNEIVTVGDDSTIRLWDVEKHEIKNCTTIPTMGRAIIYDTKGEMILVGLGGRVGRGKNSKDGGISLYSKSNNGLALLDHKEDAKDWISEVKFNGRSDECAVGSHDDKIYLYSIQSKKLSLKKVFKGHSSYITHFDFSTDGKYLQSNCGAYELLFWDTKTGKQITKAKSLKNTSWLTQTCVLGWGVQGIWPACSDGTDINAVDLNKKTKILATSDDFGLVKFFNYPCVEKNSSYVEGSGHSSHVTCIRFGNNKHDDYIYSTGGNDRSIIEWKLNYNNESNEGLVDDNSEEQEQESIEDKKKDENPFEFEMSGGGGDEFMAVKPWLGSIFAPSQLPPISTALPQKSLELHTVFGYQAQNSRNNLRYTATNNIVYHVAAVGVIQPLTKKQIFNTDHTDDITCLCIDPSLRYVATGEVGPKPLIVIWDSTSGEKITVLKGFHTKGIATLAFSPDGNLLATVGSDQNHSVALYGAINGSWGKWKLMGSNKGDKNNTLFVSWINDGTFMTGGVKHGNLWNAGSVTSKRTLFKNEAQDTLVCGIALNENTMVCGTSKGKLYIYKGSECKESKELHKGSVYSLYRSENYLLSGGKDGVIGIWDENMNLLNSIQLNDVFADQCLENSVISVCLNSNEEKMLVGTGSSDIIEFNFDSSSNQIKNGRKLQTGHYEDELWGVCANPVDFGTICSVGDDKTLRVWSIPKRQCVNIIKLPRMSRCVSMRSDGKRLCVGLGGRLGGKRSSKVKKDNENIGGFMVYEYPTMKLLAQKLDMSNSAISDIKYSKNGKYLALGSHDTKVYIYDTTKSYSKPISQCKAGHSYISHIDFSEDNKYVKVTYGDYELLFYEVETGKHMNKPSLLKDVKWNTENCVLGWGVQGIWANTSDGTDINAVDKSHNGDLLVAGDDFGKVRLYRYPVITKEHKYSEGVGHSSHVAGCCFTKNDRYVVSSGGNDRGCFVWKLIVKELSKRENYVCLEAKEDKSDEMKVMKVYVKKEIFEEDVERYKCCLERLRKLSVSHVCKMEDIKDDGSNMLIVMQKYSTSLENINPVEYFKSCGIKEQLKIICECISAFHANGLIYGNLKPSNILVDEENNYYLSDYFCNILRRNMKIGINEISYLSPEMIKNEEISEKNDIWSIGCLIYYLLSGKRIFDGETLEEIKVKVLRSEYKELDSELLNTLINKLLKINSEERISINELLEEMLKINSMYFLPINPFNDHLREIRDKGDECFNRKDYSKAIEYYSDCLDCVSNDKERCEIQISIGTSYYLLKKHLKALKAYEEALNYSSEVDNNTICNIHIFIGTIYNHLFKCTGKLKPLQESLKSFQEALNYSSEVNNYRKCEIHYFIGLSYFHFGKYTESLQSLQEALNYSSEVENCLKCDIHRILGECYYYLDKCNEAIQSLQESLNYSSEVEDWRKCEIHLCIGESYYYLKKYPEALKSLQEAITYDDGTCKVEIYFFIGKCNFWKFVSF